MNSYTGMNIPALNKKPLYGALALSGLLLIGIVTLLFLVSSEYRTVGLLRNQIQALESDTALIKSAEQIFATQNDEIKVINSAFPDEDSIPEFIQDLQDILTANSDGNVYKLVTKSPMEENGKLLLVWTITVKTDSGRFLRLLSSIERMPYLIHVVSMVGKMPDGPGKIGEYQIMLKVYVKNQFSNR